MLKFFKKNKHFTYFTLLGAIRSSLSLRKTLLNKAVQTETREKPLQTIESVLNNNTTNRKICF